LFDEVLDHNAEGEFIITPVQEVKEAVLKRSRGTWYAHLICLYLSELQALEEEEN
jgi:hypothetical protein